MTRTQSLSLYLAILVLTAVFWLRLEAWLAATGV
ncbi:hypothetical protein ABID12_004163 [Martelella mangrovi]|uniref:Uncharacterized protein n=1 Tax=Martelella mangrovi TaxID=1397477 RepID=A0ABV2IH03_9HYPH